MTSLAEARAELRAHIDNGISCPCCGQFAKVYRRHVYSTIARALIMMHRHDATAEDGFMHVPTLLAGNHGRNGDTSLAQHWGLIEEESTLRPDGGRTGWWRLTEAGRLFVLGGHKVQKYALIYDGRCLGYEGPSWGIHDALGSGFDYHELMTA